MSDSGEPEPLLTFYQYVLAAYRLFPVIQSKISGKICDHLGELLVAVQQAVVCEQGPTSVEEVRAYEPSLRAPALVFLLENYGRDNSGGDDLRGDIARWSGYLWQQEQEEDLLPLVDAGVRTAEDLVRWFRCHEALLGAV